jgi:hypothetical protein
MKVNRVFLTAAVAAISAVAVSSCFHDPYYSGSSYSSGYRSGYGSGYGYGGRSFTTTYFVHTGSPRWGYDPYARCYYDYSRRCYYDPYLNGYYPVGYRPRCVQAAPHPHGWRSGGRFIAPPSQIRDRKIDNYQNREDRYRGLNTDWSRNLQVNTRTREADSHSDAHMPSRLAAETKDGSFFGSPGLDRRGGMSGGSPENHEQAAQHSNRSQSGIFESKQERPRSSRQDRNERETDRSNRDTEARQGRSGRNHESLKSDVVRPQENRDAEAASSIKGFD